jgi:hypothetical protein
VQQRVREGLTEDVEYVYAALSALAASNNEADKDFAMEEATKRLRDSSPAEQVVAAAVLGQLGARAKSSIPSLLRILSPDGPPDSYSVVTTPRAAIQVPVEALRSDYSGAAFSRSGLVGTILSTCPRDAAILALVPIGDSSPEVIAALELELKSRAKLAIGGRPQQNRDNRGKSYPFPEVPDSFQPDFVRQVLDYLKSRAASNAEAKP